MGNITAVFFALCVLFSFTGTIPAHALTCAPPKPIKDELSSSTVVFAGTALNPNTEKYGGTVAFHVKTLWKGDIEAIEQGIPVGNMWKEIKAGQEYFIFASDSNGRLEANVCGNSNLLSEISQEQLTELGAGQRVEQPPVRGDKQLLWFILSFLGIAMVGIAFRSRMP